MIDLQKTSGYFEQIGVVLPSSVSTNKSSQGQYVLTNCPLSPWTHLSGRDGNPSFFVWFNPDGPNTYHCMSCDERGSLWQLFQEYGQRANNPDVQALALELLKVDVVSLASKFTRIQSRLRQQPDEELFETSNIVPGKVIDNFPPAWQHPHSRAYLESRGVDLITCGRFNLRFDTQNTRIVFPVYDKEFQCVGAVGRSFPPGDEIKKKYWNYFNFQAAKTLGGINFTDDYKYNKILVLEGYFDLLHCWLWCVQEEVLPVCTWKATVSQGQLTKLVGCGKILLCGYDNDDAGNRGANKFIKEGYDNGLIIRKMQLLMNTDVGEITQSGFIQALNQTKLFPKEQ